MINMAYRFNSGTVRDCYITKAIETTFVGKPLPFDGTIRSGLYLREPLVPTNIVPAISYYLSTGTGDVIFAASDQSATSWCGLKISGDATNLLIQSGYAYGGNFTVANTIFSGPYDTNTTILNIYLVYYGEPSTSYPDFTKIAILLAPLYPVATRLETFIYSSNEVTWLFGTYDTTGSSYGPTAFNVYSVDPTSALYRENWQYYYRSDDVYSAPNQQIYAENYPAIFSVNQTIDTLYDASGIHPHEETPPPPEDTPFTPSEPEPYAPTQDDSSDPITIPGNPTIGVSTAGFINVYNPGINALQGLGNILFPNVASATDVMDAILKVCETIANQNLINYVIDCHIIPVTPQTSGNETIKVGYRDTGLSVPKVSSDYIDATCGSLNIKEWFSSFADYLGTRSKLYLPFIGFVDTLPEYWQSGTISVDYKFNIIDGSFMCYVRSVSSKSQLNNSVIAQYAGNACLHIPITGLNYASMVSGIIGSTIGIATGGSASSVLGAAQSLNNTIAQGGDMVQSNGYNSTAALMGVRYPYLLIERAVPSYPTNYKHDKAYPSNISTKLEMITGYTIIEDIDLSGIPFTSDELQELRQLLADGVYF